MANPPRAVLDTSVLVPYSTRAALIDAIADGRFSGIWSPHIIAELNRVLTIAWIDRRGASKPELRKMSVSAKAMHRLLSNACDLCDTKDPQEPVWPTMRDPDDIHLYTAAKRSSATYVVSDNKKDFPPADSGGNHIFNGVEYVTAATFLARI